MTLQKLRWWKITLLPLVRGDRRKSTSSVVRAKRKLEYITIYIITAFAFCYGPYYVHAILTSWGKDKDNAPPNSNVLLIWVQTCLYMAPVIYPIIFCFMLSDVQQFLRGFCKADEHGKDGFVEGATRSSPSMVTRYTNVSRMMSTPPNLTPELPQ